MIIILLTSILSTFFLVQIKMLGGRVQEGMMDGEEAEEAAEEGEETAEEEEEKDEAAAALAALTKSDTEGFRMRRLRK